MFVSLQLIQGHKTKISKPQCMDYPHFQHRVSANPDHLPELQYHAVLGLQTGRANQPRKQKQERGKKEKKKRISVEHLIFQGIKTSFAELPGILGRYRLV